MTRWRIALGVVGLMAAALAATPVGSAQPLSPAVAWRDCAPWDGPAFTVALGRPGAKDVDREQPWMRISIWHEAAIRKTVTYRFPDTDMQTGGVAYGGTAFPSVAGTVTFPRAVFGEDLDGTFDLVAPDGQRLAGRFHGSWRPEMAMCGFEDPGTH